MIRFDLIYEAAMEDMKSKAIEATRQRVKDHIARVKFFYKQLLKSGMIPQNDQNQDEVSRHDQDKLEPENLRRQSLRMTAGGKLDPKDEKDIYEVIRDHVKSNPHHCEYWSKDPSQDHMSKNMDCTSMPDKYLYEMMADWASTAEERGGKIMSWYDKCVTQEHRWNFSDHQTEIMLKCIDFLQSKIDPGKKRSYGFDYVDPAVVGRGK